MGISNLNNKHLSEEQIAAAKQALIDLETALELLDINLTPQQRNKYGRVNEQNKLFINKVENFAKAQPDLRSFDVDWDEFFKDFQSREVLEMLINRLNSLATRATNAKILHDFDNYQDALHDYAYTSFRAGSNAVGFEDKYKELKQFFSRNKKKDAENAPNDNENQTDND